MVATTQIDRPASRQKAQLPTRFYRPELDCLRFFAFLAVFICHTSYRPLNYFEARHIPDWVGRIAEAFPLAGMRGVDLFFALSAYLITALLLREKQELGTLDVRSFYIRRILRIWPLYYFVILLAVAFSLTLSRRSFPALYLLSLFFLVGNWGVLLPGGSIRMTGPLWSVSVEEQFYLFWPPIVKRLTRRQIIHASLVMITAATLSRVAMMLLHFTGIQIYANTLTRLDTIGGGILLAALLRGGLPKLKLSVRVALMGCALTGLLLTGYLKEFQTHPIWTEMLLSYPVIALSCNAMIYAFLGLRMEIPWLQYLGKISYGLYAYHAVFLLVADRLAGAFPAFSHWRIFVALALTIATAAASYRFLEAPFLRLKKRFTHVRSRPI